MLFGAGRDAVAGKRATLGPGFRRRRALSVEDVEITGDHAFGAASPTPAGAATGQISTHLPQRVQASIISAVRARSAASKAVSVIAPGTPNGMLAARCCFSQRQQEKGRRAAISF